MIKVEGKSHWVQWLLWGVPVLWLVYMIVVHYPGVPTHDTDCQLREALSGVYNNWKPALYSYQLALFSKLAPGEEIGCSFILQLLCFAAAVAIIAHHYSRVGLQYALLVAVLPLFFTVKGMLVTTVGNDEQAAACYLLYIAMILRASALAGGKWRVMMVVAAWMILGYGLVLRHNAFPAVFLLSCWGAWRLGMRNRWRVALVSICALGAAFGISCFWSYYVLESEPSYPLRSPLADDIVNISILQGEWHPLMSDPPQKDIHQKVPPPVEACVFFPESGFSYSPLRPSYLYPKISQRLRDYELLREAWWDIVSKNPGYYVITKLFFFHQFLLEGRCLPWCSDMLKARFPHITIGMDQASRHWRAWVNQGFVVMALVPLLCYLFLWMVVIKRVRQWVMADVVRIDAVVFVAVAFLYTSSFLLLVLSATEARYYIIRASLCCVGGSLLLLSLLHRRKKN